MSEQALRAVAIQESLNLSKQDAMKVLVFIAGLQAGKGLSDVDGQNTSRPLGLDESIRYFDGR